MALIDKLTNIANAIREKTGGTDPLTLDAMAEAIESIETGGGGEADHSMEDGMVEGTITEYRNQRVTKIGKMLFFENPTIQKVEFDSVVSITGSSSFSKCTNLETAIFPVLVNSGYDMFFQCSKLSNVIMPNVTSLNRYMFQRCTALKFLDFNCLTNIMGQAFDGAGIETLIIRTNKVCTLQDTTLKSQVTVYVPSALIESYKTATNWSTLYAAGTCNFVAIEGSEYE